LSYFASLNVILFALIPVSNVLNRIVLARRYQLLATGGTDINVTLLALSTVCELPLESTVPLVRGSWTAPDSAEAGTRGRAGPASVVERRARVSCLRTMRAKRACMHLGYRFLPRG